MQHASHDLLLDEHCGGAPAHIIALTFKHLELLRGQLLGERDEERAHLQTTDTSRQPSEPQDLGKKPERRGGCRCGRGHQASTSSVRNGPVEKGERAGVVACNLSAARATFSISSESKHVEFAKQHVPSDQSTSLVASPHMKLICVWHGQT